MKVKNSQKAAQNTYPFISTIIIFVSKPNSARERNLTKTYPDCKDNAKKKRTANSSLAAPIHAPKIKECRLNFGTHILHMGQCIVLNDFGIPHCLHFIWGFSKYGLISYIFIAFCLFSLVEWEPLVLKAAKTKNTRGNIIMKRFT